MVSRTSMTFQRDGVVQVLTTIGTSYREVGSAVGQVKCLEWGLRNVGLPYRTIILNTD